MKLSAGFVARLVELFLNGKLERLQPSPVACSLSEPGKTKGWFKMFTTYKTRQADLPLRVMHTGCKFRIIELEEKPTDYQSLPELPLVEDTLNPGDKVIIEPIPGLFFFGRCLQ